MSDFAHVFVFSWRRFYRDYEGVCSPPPTSVIFKRRRVEVWICFGQSVSEKEHRNVNNNYHSLLACFDHHSGRSRYPSSLKCLICCSGEEAGILTNDTHLKTTSCERIDEGRVLQSFDLPYMSADLKFYCFVNGDVREGRVSMTTAIPSFIAL